MAEIDRRWESQSRDRMNVDGYPFHSPGRYILWFPFELSPGDCGLVSEADTHLNVNPVDRKGTH
jgi:hypothetical protein